MPSFDFHSVVFCADLGKVEEGVFDPSTLDPERCESCYGAETEDLKWVSPPQTEQLWCYGRLDICLKNRSFYWCETGSENFSYDPCSWQTLQDSQDSQHSQDSSSSSSSPGWMRKRWMIRFKNPPGISHLNWFSICKSHCKL